MELQNVLETGFMLSPRSGDIEIGRVIHLTGPSHIQVSACEAVDIPPGGPRHSALDSAYLLRFNMSPGLCSALSFESVECICDLRDGWPAQLEGLVSGEKRGRIRVLGPELPVRPSCFRLRMTETFNFDHDRHTPVLLPNSLYAMFVN